MYIKYIKCPLDVTLAVLAIIVLSPLLIALTVIGAIKMKGNPFFLQTRPGKNGKLFKLIKFRTMTCQKDGNGNLLPDELRLTSYGKWLRSTSLDELGELFNIASAKMAIVGPRPLLTQYLPLYNEEQNRRHEVRPGLTGNAQIHGRNSIPWEEKFRLDVEYVQNITFIGDLKIILKTVKTVLKREGISSGKSATTEVFRGNTEENRLTANEFQTVDIK